MDNLYVRSGSDLVWSKVVLVVHENSETFVIDAFGEKHELGAESTELLDISKQELYDELDFFINGISFLGRDCE